MKWLVFVLILGLLDTGQAQSQPRENLFNAQRTDIIFFVKKSPTGADNVNVSLSARGYPPALLRSQLEKLGKELGTGVRLGGITQEVTDTATKETFLKAFFAADGLIDTTNGGLKIQPILRAFAGAPAPFTIQGFSIFFNDVVPSETLLSQYDLKGVLESDARFSKQPFHGIEYRIRLLTQDPTKIHFPDRRTDSQPNPPQPTSIGDNRFVLIALFVVSGIVAGALVYLALLRTGRHARS